MLVSPFTLRGQQWPWKEASRVLHGRSEGGQERAGRADQGTVDWSPFLNQKCQMFIKADYLGVQFRHVIVSVLRS